MNIHHDFTAKFLTTTNATTDKTDAQQANATPEPKLHRTDHFFLCGAARSDMLITTPCLLMWEDRHAGSAPTEADQRTRDTDLAAAHSIAYHMRLNITPCITHVRVSRDT